MIGRQQTTTRAIALIVCALVLGATLLLHGELSASLAEPATPAPMPAEVIASEVLGRATPAVIASPELALRRVTIMPGAVIPVHRHPGTQVSAVVQGDLTYTVFTGAVAWYHGDDPTGLPAMINPGQTVTVRAGDTLVEPPDAIHQGRNIGSVPITIYLSTLFPAGAPGSILVEATPAA
jgi:quercetin dioxygenase-like cupin family protein